MEYGVIGEHLIHSFRLHIRFIATLNLLCKHIHRQRTGNVAGFGTAHTVADHTQQCVFIQLLNCIGILITGADTAGV